MSLTAAWDNYSGTCKCGKRYNNNCAHFLSNALIKGGFDALDGGKGADLRIVGGRCVCTEGRPIRAKELRDYFQSTGTRVSEIDETTMYFVYQERSDGQGHVLRKGVE